VNVIIIAAKSLNNVIGRDGRLPWNVPLEYQHFLDSVSSQVMLMGRRSWEVFGGEVNTMANGVLSRSTEVFGADAIFSNIEKAIIWARSFKCERIFVAGGAQVYGAALDAAVVDELWLSTLPFECEGDVHFPSFERQCWEVQAEQREGYLFEKWTRIRSKSASL
jgi:dihydrofolate reductase